MKTILHITAGDESWNPSKEDLFKIFKLFQHADLDPMGTTFITRCGIKVELQSVEDSFDGTIRVVSAHASAEDLAIFNAG